MRDTPYRNLQADTPWCMFSKKLNENLFGLGFWAYALFHVADRDVYPTWINFGACDMGASACVCLNTFSWSWKQANMHAQMSSLESQNHVFVSVHARNPYVCAHRPWSHPNFRWLPSGAQYRDSHGRKSRPCPRSLKSAESHDVTLHYIFNFRLSQIPERSRPGLDFHKTNKIFFRKSTRWFYSITPSQIDIFRD